MFSDLPRWGVVNRAGAGACLKPSSSPHHLGVGTRGSVRLGRSHRAVLATISCPIHFPLWRQVTPGAIPEEVALRLGGGA